LPNFTVIGQTVTEISRFVDFSSHLGFLYFRNFKGQKGKEGEIASSSLISWRSVKPLLKYGDFSILKMAAIRHLGFLKGRNFIGR